MVEDEVNLLQMTGGDSPKNYVSKMQTFLELELVPPEV
jgi:hypothetical protein